MFIDPPLRYASDAFDKFREFWENPQTEKSVSFCLMVTFIAALLLMEMNRMGLLPAPFSEYIPTRSYLAISLAFSLVLILEVISLILTLPASMSRAVGKQFEILALILLRNAFKAIVDLPEPISLVGKIDVLWHILAYGGGGIVIFGLLGVYLKTLKKQDDIIPGESLTRFIRSKKLVSLIMLFLFIAMGSYNLGLLLTGGPGFHFFQYFYTLLIFSDVLMVLIAQSFLPEFAAIFRNSGYALSTLLIRMSLTAPIYVDVMTAVFAILFAISITLIYNRFYQRDRKESDRQS